MVSNKREGLGEEFLAEVKDALKIIARKPKFFPFRNKTIRSFRMNRFPFLILYAIKGKYVDVIAVFHTSRDPKKWKSRK